MSRLGDRVVSGPGTAFSLEKKVLAGPPCLYVWMTRVWMARRRGTANRPRIKYIQSDAVPRPGEGAPHGPGHGVFRVKI